jgi:hypothetical protein
MKKVAIITLNDYVNYGNRLQNYALEYVVRNISPGEVDVKTLRYDARDMNVASIYTRLTQRNIASILRIIAKRISNKLNQKIQQDKVKRFKDFSEQYLNETEEIYNKNNLPEDLNKMYDYFIVGSDQVWNPKNVYNDSFYFISFGSENQRIAYAPSFGVENIPEEYIKSYTDWLKEMTHISVREDLGQQIIRQLANVEAPVLVDPTLLLAKEEWLKISKPHKSKPSKPFILTYFLGDEKYTSRKYIEELSKEYNMEVVNLYDISNPTYYTVDPGEFIDYFYTCAIVFTDSFHGSVFSILFDKPFVVFKRGNINSRIDTLLLKFGLEDRKWDSISKNKNYFNINYNKKNEVLELERNKSKEFLIHALQIRKSIKQ